MRSDYRTRIASYLSDFNRNDYVSYFLLIFYLAAITFYLKPFAGFTHDGVLYAFNALAYKNEALANNDLLTMYFDQGSLSIFTLIYSQFIDWFGLNNGALYLYRASYLIWLFSFFYCFRTLSTSLFVASALMLVLLASPGWYQGNVFAVGERFLTSRIMAEGLSFLALGLFASQRYLICLAVSVCAALVHPLIGVWIPVLVIACGCLRYLGLKLFTFLFVFLTGVGINFLGCMCRAQFFAPALSI